MEPVNLEPEISNPHLNEDPEEERLTPAQRLHHQFNEASARVDALRRLIEMRKALGEDFSPLWQMLQQAEAEKRRTHAKLAETGRWKLLSRVGAAQ